MENKYPFSHLHKIEWHMDAVWAGKQPYSGAAHLKELSTPHLLIFWVRLHKYEDQKLFILTP